MALMSAAEAAFEEARGGLRGGVAVVLLDLDQRGVAIFGFWRGDRVGSDLECGMRFNELNGRLRMLLSRPHGATRRSRLARRVDVASMVDGRSPGHGTRHATQSGLLMVLK